MNKTCIEHNEYFTGCISCQHDMAEEIEILKDKLMKLNGGNVAQPERPTGSEASNFS